MLKVMSNFPTTRLRRLRSSAAMRGLIRETELSINHFIYPLFIHHGKGIKKPITSMPGCFQLSVDQLAAEIKEIVVLQIPAVILFGIPEHKNDQCTTSYDDKGVVQQAIREIKEIAPDLLVFADVCCCEYTPHCHCGILDAKGDVDNDATLGVLAKQAVSFANAGVDMVAPSGNMDGMVQSIRLALDQHNFGQIPIMSYSAKYCSGLYGPFREAANSVLKTGDRKTYQMDPANANEALRETALDIEEGADIVMVKPAGFYLDVIHRMKQNFPELPLAAYQIGGEYSMIKAAAQNGWLDEKKVALESLLAIKRAGAGIIISYFAKDVAKWLRE